jgi:hypothetical protein
MEEFANKNQRKAARRRERERTVAQRIYEFCEAHDLDFAELQTWQIRVTRKDIRVDIYPIKQRYHNIGTNERGFYSDEIKFLKELYSIL